MATDLDETYTISDDPVYLDIMIGNAQSGRSLVRLDDEWIGTGAIRDLLLGDGPALVGKTLRIRTVVNDVNPQTNRTTVRYTLRGGLTDESFDLNAAAPQAGDWVIYRATFHFSA